MTLRRLGDWIEMIQKLKRYKTTRDTTSFIVLLPMYVSLTINSLNSLNSLNHSYYFCNIEYLNYTKILKNEKVCFYNQSLFTKDKRVFQIYCKLDC